MTEGVEPKVLGLPDNFDLTDEQARAIDADAILSGASFEHGLWGAVAPLVAARESAHKRDAHLEEQAIQLLVVVAGMTPTDDARSPYGRSMSGHDGAGHPWHTPLPADLTHQHLEAIATYLAVSATPVLRARLADVLWYRLTPRKPEHARMAVDAYLRLAHETFSPDQWTLSEQYFGRAFRIASHLGRESEEFAAVVAAAWSFLDQLDGNDPLYYTERIVSRIVEAVSIFERTTLFERVESLAEQSLNSYDFERARTYYSLSIRLAKLLARGEDVKSLRLRRAETFATQAFMGPNETQRGVNLRIARQELLNAGASRARIAQIAALLDESQLLAVREMTSIGTELHLGKLPDYIRGFVSGHDPIEALWMLSAAPVMLNRQHVRDISEESVKKYVFAYGFNRRHLSHDGRQQGETPGAIGRSESDLDSAIRGVMRDHAAQGRIYAVLGAIEPGREQLLLEHEYTLAEIYTALRPRPFIPQGHHVLWAKAIHAGLVGEYDIAVHILAPQIENALREVLRRQGEIVYTTRDGVQSLLSIENVLDHPKSQQIFGDDFLFALDTALAGRLGANVRNNVAHGLLNDVLSNSYDTAFVWWLALRLLRAYGPDPLGPASSQQNA